MKYVGRFAPSPTGPLHLGSLLTAVVSYLHAKQQQGQWRLRMDDIDPPRESPGSKEHIISALSCYGLIWQQPIIYQSQQTPSYEQALTELAQRQQLFWCQCSRKQLSGTNHYPGYCYQQGPRINSAIRLHHQQPMHWHDQLQGPQLGRQATAQDVVLKRRDGLYAYHLASVIDDHDFGITDVVRGLDLMDSTAAHICLQRCLALNEPKYWHLPLVLGADGQKLSKQTGAQALSLQPECAQMTLASLLTALIDEPIFHRAQTCREQLDLALPRLNMAKWVKQSHITI